MDEVIKLLTMYGVPTAIATALIACGSGLYGIGKRYRESRMSSDYVQHRIEKLERLLDDEWSEADLGRNGPPPKDQRPLGFLPPPPPARRAVAQSGTATANNVRYASGIVQAAERLARSSGMSVETAMRMLERATQIQPSANPRAAITPKIDNPRKRKVTLE